MEKMTYSPDDESGAMRQTAIRMPESYFDGIEEIAKNEERKPASVIRHAVRLYLEAYQEAHK